MDRSYWQKQTLDKPLFNNIIWSRPVNKRLQGRLQIIGGNIHGISSPSFAYSEALKQNVGSVKVYLPDKTAKLLPPKPTDIEFLPSTVNGSFSQDALSLIQSNAKQADALLLAGDFAKNSETYILLEKIATLEGLQAYTKDSLDAFIKTPKILLERPDTLLVTDFARLQKAFTNSGFDRALTSSINLMQFVELLHEFTLKYGSVLVTRLDKTYFVANKGEVITTNLPDKDFTWEQLAAAACVWWLQHPTKPLESIATSLVNLVASGTAGRT